MHPIRTSPKFGLLIKSKGSGLFGKGSEQRIFLGMVCEYIDVEVCGSFINSRAHVTHGSTQDSRVGGCWFDQC